MSKPHLSYTIADLKTSRTSLRINTGWQTSNLGNNGASNTPCLQLISDSGRHTFCNKRSLPNKLQVYFFGGGGGRRACKKDVPHAFTLLNANACFGNLVLLSHSQVLLASFQSARSFLIWMNADVPVQSKVHVAHPHCNLHIYFFCTPQPH